MPLALPVPVAELERVLQTRSATARPEDVGLPGASALPEGVPARDRVLAAVRRDVDRAAELMSSWLAEPQARAGKP